MWITSRSGGEVLFVFEERLMKRVCIYDTNFEPYFYVVPRQKRGYSASSISSCYSKLMMQTVWLLLFAQNCEKMLLGQEVDAVKVIVIIRRIFLSCVKKSKCSRKLLINLSLIFHSHVAIFLIKIIPLSCIVHGEEMIDVAVDIVLKADTVQQHGDVFIKIRAFLF